MLNHTQLEGHHSRFYDQGYRTEAASKQSLHSGSKVGHEQEAVVAIVTEAVDESASTRHQYHLDPCEASASSYQELPLPKAG